MGTSVPALAKHYGVVNTMEGHHSLVTAELWYYFNWVLPTDLHAQFAKDAREHVVLTLNSLHSISKAGVNLGVDTEFSNSSWTNAIGHLRLNIYNQ